MRECICCQCREHASQFKDWLRCECCELYGSEQEFNDDPNKDHCDGCWATQFEGGEESEAPTEATKGAEGD